MEEKFPKSNYKKSLLFEVYKDLAQPSIKKMGIVFEEIIDLATLILLPLKLSNEKIKLRFEKRLSKFSQKLANIDNQDLFPIRPEIGMPILENLVVVSDEKIAELYLNLLTTESNSNHRELSHPNFVNIVKSITPKEAKFLDSLNPQIRILRDFITKEDLSHLPLNDKKYDPFFLSNTDYIYYPKRFEFKKRENELIYKKISEYDGIGSVKEIKVILDNLISLGLLKVADVYHNFNSIKTQGEINDGNFTKKIATICLISDLGEKFMKACRTKINFNIKGWKEWNRVNSFYDCFLNLEEAKQAIKLDKIEDALGFVENEIKKGNMKSELIQISLISSNYFRLRHQYLSNTISIEYYNIEMSKINLSILELIKEVKKSFHNGM